jgi:hypothetical protein
VTICREIGDQEGLVKALTMQAQILGLMGRAAEAVPLAEEAVRVANQFGLQVFVQQMAQPILAFVQAGGRPGGTPDSAAKELSAEAQAEEARRQQEEAELWKKMMLQASEEAPAKARPFWKRWFR